jgi:ABC-type lipoprotein release transport system permease subunit
VARRAGEQQARTVTPTSRPAPKKYARGSYSGTPHSQLASLLYGVKPLDAAALAGVSILLSAVALLASYIAARHAANADPMESLRYE